MKLSGWVIDVNSELDFRFIRLFQSKGTFGAYIYYLMRNAICVQHGYYAILDNALLANIHYKLGHCTKPIKIIKETIELFGEIGILDKSLLKSNILTSADIQENWLTAKRARRARIPENLKYWLLDDNLPSNFSDNCSNNSKNCNNNNNNYSNNRDNYAIDINSNKLVQEKELSIDNTGFPESKEDLLRQKFIYKINDELSEEKYDTDRYLLENINQRLKQKYECISLDSKFSWDLFFEIDEDIRIKYLKMLSNACYDNREQKYSSLVVDYKVFRAFVNRTNISKLRQLIHLMERAKNVENEDYYMRGIIVNWVIEMAKADEKESLKKSWRGNE